MLFTDMKILKEKLQNYGKKRKKRNKEQFSRILARRIEEEIKV